MAAKYKTKCRLCKQYKIIKPGFSYCIECWKRATPTARDLKAIGAD